VLNEEEERVRRGMNSEDISLLMFSVEEVNVWNLVRVEQMVRSHFEN
jgi:hypothetical protein